MMEKSNLNIYVRLNDPPVQFGLLAPKTIGISFEAIGVLFTGRYAKLE